MQRLLRFLLRPEALLGEGARDMPQFGWFRCSIPGALFPLQIAFLVIPVLFHTYPKLSVYEIYKHPNAFCLYSKRKSASRSSVPCRFPWKPVAPKRKHSSRGCSKIPLLIRKPLIEATSRMSDRDA
ncbi:hypothetical protein HMPREF9412_1371 [Paenibacillus sp. HGF5]|nr:hypothetical protein HMPREF9412_1371 [Paenibacillus sp. HGF5]